MTRYGARVQSPFPPPVQSAGFFLEGGFLVLIDDYEFGSIQIDGRTYTSDVILAPESVSDSWWREKGHELNRTDLEPVMADNPDILVIGTGANGAVTVLPEARELMEKQCDQVHVLKTREAVRRYNELAKKGDRRVVAALHLTC
jgi:hypothetical protein